MIGLFLERIEWLDAVNLLLENQLEYEELNPEHSYSESTYLRFRWNDAEMVCIVTQGAPVTAATLELLSKKFNFSAIYRLGTMGGFQSYLNIGDFVVPSGAIVGEGTSLGYVPSGFPAIPDLKLANKLYHYFSKLNTTYYGTIYTLDAAFSTSPLSKIEDYKNLEKVNCLGVDMETSSFFNVCMVKNIPCASLQIVSDLPNYKSKESPELYAYKVQNKIKEIIKNLLNVASNTNKEDYYEC